MVKHNKTKVHLCEECKDFITTKLIRCCACGEFCSKKCQDFYHKDTAKKIMQGAKRFK